MTIEVQENREPKVIEVTEIMNMLPHRYPFLLVDRVTDYEEGKWLKQLKTLQ
ncbi:(3R)-hydroxymyristoyl-ACP dehydratase [Actinobacillus equuli]|nr:(3R)-hydroxymyristoyl-ACP dehydratase [Actinobacillus equuli]